MLNSLKIRQAKKSDEQEILKLWKDQEIWHRNLDPLLYPKVDDKLMRKMKQYLNKVLKSRKMHLYVSLIEDKIVGFILFHTEADDYFDAVYEQYGEIYEIFVDKKFREKGVGRALMLFADTFFRKRGLRFMVLHSSFFNKSAHEFYKKLGYEVRSLKLTKKI